MEDFVARQKVYDAIDTERAYQEIMEAKFGWQPKKKVGEWIVLINHYTTKLNEAWSTATGDDEALKVMRKIAGIAVHCMEENGVSQRKLTE